ncbi:MAG TPA: zinc-dependent metalloprotease [Casimicrobiaceae bacterium]|nr:zinc-dependent metalloprotease [Casimicrobiaceae bacterium]
MSHRHVSRAAAALGIVAPFVIAGCASLPRTDAAKPADTAAIAAAAASAAREAATEPEHGATPGPNGARANAAAAAATAAAQAAQFSKPFADVVKDAKKQTGLIDIWRKDDKVWLEIAPDQFDKPFFFKSAVNQGIGEHRIFGGAMTWPIGVAQIVVFHKHGQNVQLIARNVKYTAKPGTPEARAVAAGFSDSLLAVAPIASQPSSDRKSVLIDANALLLADIPAGAAVLERTYHQGYAFDPRNSSIGTTRTEPDEITLEVSAHYAVSRIAVPMPGHGPGPQPSQPSTVPDPRSLFLGYHYTLAKLPETPMHPRLADERVGYFTTEVLDFTSDVPRVPVERYANHWRLEKKDPNAALSEPKQPIVFWLDRNIPVKYREPIKEGILEWNKAFERIGFKDAVKVEIQPDDADFDTSDIHHASVRWQTVAKTSYGAIGPSVVDPRTGEILDADIGIDANNVRVVRNLRHEYLPPRRDAFAAFREATSGNAHIASDAEACDYEDAAAQETAFGMSLLEARGELDPDSPDVDKFVNLFLKSVVMHEVGHTLGLRHNFRASTVFTEAELSDPTFTAEHGISGSVMEYNPWNLAVSGERQGEYAMSTLGPYDYWAIEYAYKPIAPDKEAAELAKIASRSNEPWLAYSTDEDVSYFAIDPAVNQLDLGSDPLAYARKRLALVHELWQRTESMQLKPDESYSVLRRNFTRGLNEAGQGALYASKYIGGLTTLRDRYGSGRQPFTPIDAAKQREALHMLASEVLSADSFNFPPSFLRKMTVSTFDIDDAQELGRPTPPLDLSIDQQVLSLQRGVLDTLMSPPIAQRLLNNIAKVDNPKQALKLSELYETLHDAVFSELKTGRDITLFRRNLQREFATRVADALIKPAGSMPEDARALLRVEATRLRADLARAPTGRMSEEAKAHILELEAMLDEARKAPIVRQAV